MKTENNILRKVNSAIALFAFLLVSYSSGYSQCNLACNSNVQVSLDDDCSVIILADMILEGAATSGCTYTVSLELADGTPIPNATVTSDHIGLTITAQIFDDSNNSCWGSIKVEDKLAPVLNCPADVTVQCYETVTPFTTAQIQASYLTDNCGDATVTLVSDITNDIGCTEAYDHDNNPATAGIVGFSAVRTVTYIAQDASGNVSNQCSYQIFFDRVDLYDGAGALNITWPADQNVSCVDYTTWDNELNNMGVPELNGTSFGIYPNTSYCELNATYSDVIIDLCGPEYKVVREWTVLDWCSGEIARHNQIIKVEQGSLFFTTQMGCDLEGVSDAYSCTGSYQIPSNHYDFRGFCPGLGYTYQVFLLTSGEYPNDGDSDPLNPNNPDLDGDINSCDCPNSFPGIFQQVGGTYTDLTSPPNLTGLAYGCNWVKTVLTTECGEVIETSFEVLINDTTPPNPVCDQHTTVSVGPNGWAVANATSFDDGSFDFCSDNLTFGVVRTNGSCSAVSPGAPTVFGTYGGTTYYEFEKFCCTDIGTTVDVQMVVVDESGNWNICTVEVTVQDASDVALNQVYSCPSSIMNPVGPFSCGAESSTNIIVTANPTINTAAQNVICFNYFVGNPDNYLSGRIFEDSPVTNVQDCGDFSFVRTWGIYRTDLSQPGSAPVRIATCSSTVNISVENTFTMSSSGWPADQLNLTGCINADTSPSTTGSPSFSNNDCSLVADTYTDQVFNFVDNACYKILRTWTVIDWCQYNANNPGAGGIWQHVQVIKVNDNTAPVPVAETTNILIENKTGCAMMGTSTPVSGNDNCGTLTYSYTISPYPGFTSSGGPSSNNSVTGLWNEGTYTITWTVMDACGNSGVVNQTVNVTDAVAPTPYCLGAISTVLMESTGTVTIWASDFDLGSTDNCDNSLSMYFGNGSNNLTFDCDDLGQQLIQVYFEDDAGNRDFCTVSIDIQDNLGACVGARISGEVVSEMNEMLDDVEVNLHNMITEDDSYESTNSGQYEFVPVESNQDYQISASKEDDYMNGVSTLDLVLIQKHLLGSQLLNSPYKLMAADANNSGSVSAIDLVELRKLILGIYTELPSNESWRFVDAQQTFANVNQPWPFTEVITINQITSSMDDQNFVAVKIGDVNNTAIANATSAVSQNRSGESLDLSALTSIDNDQKVIAIKADNYDDIIGWQTTLNIEEGYEFAAINPGALELTHSNINPSIEGMLAISYNSIQGETIADDAVLFSIVLRAKTNNNLLNSLTIGSDIIETEAYTSDLEVLDITLRDDRDNLEGTFRLLQNTPNPFSENTSISFNLPERAFVTISVFDVTGRNIKEWTKEFDKGFNTVELSSGELNASGVLYYRIDAGSYTATKKMISL